MPTRYKNVGESPEHGACLILDKVVTLVRWGVSGNGSKEGFSPSPGTGRVDGTGGKAVVVSSTKEAKVRVETSLVFLWGQGTRVVSGGEVHWGEPS